TNNATGTITFHLYRGADCSPANEVAGSPVTNTTVNGNGVYVSPAIHVRSEERRVGKECNCGEAHNSATANVCNGTNENVVVNPAGPSLSTNAGADEVMGAPCAARVQSCALPVATNNATGTITFHLYRGADCSPANEVAGSPVTNTTVNGNGVYVSPAIHV